MQAGIYLGQRNIEVRDIAKPVCGDDDVLIQNIYSSICGTDVAVYNYGPATGHKVTVGGEFGHETVSRVVEVGKNIHDVKVGDRIYPYPLYAKNDMNRAGTLGGFSEYILMPHAVKNHSYYLVDEAIDDKTACLIEPFTVGGHAAKQAHPKKNEKAVVFGCGTIGIASAIMLKWLGVDKVLICDYSDYRLGIAEKMGFYTCNNAKEDFLEKAASLFGKGFSIHGNTADIDIWIDAAGVESILDSFMNHGKIDARYVIVAVNKAERHLNLLDLTYSSQSIIGSGGYRPEDVQTVMDIMKSHKWNIESIITAEYPIDQLKDALNAASDNEHNFNVIIDFKLSGNCHKE